MSQQNTVGIWEQKLLHPHALQDSSIPDLWSLSTVAPSPHWQLLKCSPTFSKYLLKVIIFLMRTTILSLLARLIEPMFSRFIFII